MDTPNLPETEPEEITWQDDENRATLFLRSVFVLLSGALILGIFIHPVAINQPVAINLVAYLFRIALLLVVLPTFIIWFFFGQGLRSVEWLSDQKYNAWNYGINFADWKTHLRWVVPLLLIGILETIFLKRVLFDDNHRHLSEWLSLTSFLWFIGICLSWFVWGYLWFGFQQGFGAIAAMVIIIILISLAFMQNIYPGNTALLVAACFVPLASLCSYICWKQKSWIPILYTVILLAPIASCILVF